MGLSATACAPACMRASHLGLLDIYQSLRRVYPLLEGWPNGDWPISRHFRPPRFEVILGSILTQNTNWKNVEKALKQLVQEGLVAARKVESCSVIQLEDAIRSSGFFRQKARRLKDVCRFILDFRGAFYREVGRDELLSIRGIGPETADSILLYACDQPHFVVDAYTRRVFVRYGLLRENSAYDEVKDFFQSRLPRDVNLYKRFHALIVEHAKQTCMKSPSCGRCVMADECTDS